jgi:hypothetical protein
LISSIFLGVEYGGVELYEGNFYQNNTLSRSQIDMLTEHHQRQVQTKYRKSERRNTKNVFVKKEIGKRNRDKKRTLS